MTTSTASPIVSEYSNLYQKVVSVISPICKTNAALCSSILNSFVSTSNRRMNTTHPPFLNGLSSKPPIQLVNMTGWNVKTPYTAYQNAITMVNYPSFVILYNQPSSSSTKPTTIIQFISNPTNPSTVPICSIVYQDAGALSFTCTTSGFVYSAHATRLVWWAILLIVLACLVAVFVCGFVLSRIVKATKSSLPTGTT